MQNNLKDFNSFLCLNSINKNFLKTDNFLKKGIKLKKIIIHNQILLCEE